MAWHRILGLLALVNVGWLAGCASPNTGPRGLLGGGRRVHVQVPDRAEGVMPIQLGVAFPCLVLHTPDGDRFRVRRDTGKKPLLLVLYRGGWCLYCNRHLAGPRRISGGPARHCTLRTCRSGLQGPGRYQDTTGGSAGDHRLASPECPDFGLAPLARIDLLVMYGR